IKRVAAFIPGDQSVAAATEYLVVAGIAPQDVVAAAADETVVAAKAVDGVVAAAAAERLVQRRALDAVISIGAGHGAFLCASGVSGCRSSALTSTEGVGSFPFTRRARSRPLVLPRR